MKPFHSRTKIVATLGPASAKPDVLYSMFNAGLDVCRLNFSHGSQADHQAVLDTIRDLNKKYDYNVGILADLQGPKIRIGLVKEGGINLINGKTTVITTNECIGNEERIYITYQNFPQDVQAGEIILLDDGKLQMKVISTNLKDEVVCEIVHGGILTSRKGVNLPNTKVSIPSLTPEDRENLEFVLENDVEWIGLSFVRKAEDIIELKKIIAERGKTARVIAKIEKPEAIANIDEIIAVTDGIMVARGDLGVECPMEEVPLLQKMIVAKCRAASKPVIVATQMLESMITTPRPTRAEVNDVANSVLDGADAVMLSGETSVGEFPLIVIETMQKIIQNIEQNNYPFNPDKFLKPKSPSFLSDAICDSACFLAKQTNAVGIVSMTLSGYTAFEISSHRPEALTFIFTSNRALLNAVSLLWGVRGFYYDKWESTDNTIIEVNEFLKSKKLVKQGDIIINTAAIPMEAKGKTNMLKITVID
ncbi:Pyruvate kinase [Pedobacter sp. Bi27]|jgi:pyruvate kinase|uniref:Pyruvate kinase n=2 Tax=Pedobacter TaxID=84567 RepID=A0A0T5VSB6_9SPHI|nr:MULTISPECIES: pyruvate kinase [Pedobacter]KRT16759.1 pyruvate kinase [Pedobacter ginsenosidimutans]TBO39672.1 pyruvate kinase [Pedobacter kyonggii]CAH0218159.1 Pyruvate kinase [Pedobacter sp. Bi27]CAH0231457.1 Pyruvate kinase [Pedobacter sp. Bi36]CAH0258238.1 Pyruvate kinase [Pedobacter sp. Bi126]